MALYPDVFQTTLQKTTSDHCPIMLNSECERWGSQTGGGSWWLRAGRARLVVKLKLLKVKIKEWAKENFGEVGATKCKILEDLQCLDSKEEMGRL